MVTPTAANCAAAKAGGLTSGKELCSSDNDDAPQVIPDATEDKYITIENLSADGFFPDGKSGEKIAVKVGTDGSALLLEEICLPECSANTSSNVCKIGGEDTDNGQHCIKDNKIYVTTISGNSKSCDQVTNSSGTTDDKEISYYDNEYKLVASSDLVDDTEYIVYECILKGTTKTYEECTIIKGYTDIGSKNIKCNGWKGEKCKLITLSACAANGNGNLGTSDSKNAICFSATETQNVVLPTTAGITEKIAFNLTNTSTDYGVLKNDIVFLSLSSTQAVVDKSSLGEGK